MTATTLLPLSVLGALASHAEGLAPLTSVPSELYASASALLAVEQVDELPSPGPAGRDSEAGLECATSGPEQQGGP